MTPILALIIIGNIFVVIINIANIRLMRKITKRHKELQERLSKLDRDISIQSRGKGRVWNIDSDRPISFKGDVVK